MNKEGINKSIIELVNEHIEKNKIPEEHAQILRKFAKVPDQKTSDQHWVPKFYLRKFTGEDGLLQTFDVNKNRVGKRHSPKSVCYGEFFYSMWTGQKDDHSQYIENLFGAFENDFAKLSLEFENQIWAYGKIGDKILWEISMHIALQYLRTPYVREKTLGWEKQFHDFYVKMTSCNEKAWREVMEEYKKENPKITDKELDEARDIFQNIDTQKKFKLKYSNDHHFRFLGQMEEIQKMFFAKTWRIFLLPESSNFKFITSDIPVLEKPPKKWDFRGMFSPSFLELTHYYPLTPRILIELSHPLEHDRPIKRVKRKQLINDLIIQDLNSHRLYDPQSQYAYSSETKEFEPLQKIKEIWEKGNLERRIALK